MVVKTGWTGQFNQLDRPVQPGTGYVSGLYHSQNWPITKPEKSIKNWIKPVSRLPRPTRFSFLTF